MQCRRQAYAAVLLAIPVAAQAVHDYFGGKVLYINVMNNLSIDCDCDGNPSKPQVADVGILASTDPIALDKACLDLVFNYDNRRHRRAAPEAHQRPPRHVDGGIW